MVAVQQRECVILNVTVHWKMVKTATFMLRIISHRRKIQTNTKNGHENCFVIQSEWLREWWCYWLIEEVGGAGSRFVGKRESAWASLCVCVCEQDSAPTVTHPYQGGVLLLVSSQGHNRRGTRRWPQACPSPCAMLGLGYRWATSEGTTNRQGVLWSLEGRSQRCLGKPWAWLGPQEGWGRGRGRGQGQLWRKI